MLKHVAILLVAAIVVSADIGLVVPERRMRLLSDDKSFRDAFSRFGPNDKQNGFTIAKLGRLGQEAELLQAYTDGTVTVRFEDGLELDMPVEALEARQPSEAPRDIVEFGSIPNSNPILLSGLHIAPKMANDKIVHPSGDLHPPPHLPPGMGLPRRMHSVNMCSHNASGPPVSHAHGHLCPMPLGLLCPCPSVSHAPRPRVSHAAFRLGMGCPIHGPCHWGAMPSLT